jgi:2-dehydro-3-deoxygalactonokinase
VIAIDWGTSRLRAWLLDASGRVRDRRDSDAGIGRLGGAGFDAALAPLLAGWPEAAPLLMCGMIGSRQGLVEAPYLPCPADPASLARALAPVAIAGRRAHVVPGLSCEPPDVMRGEETLILGAGITDGLACLPGSHSKWVHVRAGIITGFRTHLTGELFAAVADHTIVGRLMEPDDPPDWQDFFDQGLAAARAPGALLTRQLFAVRAAGLLGRLPARGLRPFASGLLIGHEIAGEAPAGTVTLIGEGALLARYARALDSLRVPHETAAAEPAPAGLFTIARAAGLLA